MKVAQTFQNVISKYNKKSLSEIVLTDATKISVRICSPQEIMSRKTMKGITTRDIKKEIVHKLK